MEPPWPAQDYIASWWSPNTFEKVTRALAVMMIFINSFIQICLSFTSLSFDNRLVSLLNKLWPKLNVDKTILLIEKNKSFFR